MSVNFREEESFTYSCETVSKMSAVGSQQLAAGKSLFSVFTFIIVICLLLFAAPIVSAEKTLSNNQDYCGVPVSGLGVCFAGGVESLIPGCAQSFALLGVGHGVVGGILG